MLRFALHFVSVSRPQSLVKPVSPENEEEHKLSEVLKTQEGRWTKSPMTASEKLRQEKEQQEPGVGASCAEARTQLHVGRESIRAGERGQDAAKGRGDLPGDQHPEPASERKVVVRGQLQNKERQGVGSPQGEQRKEVGELQQQASLELGRCRLREVKILTRQGSRSTEKTALVVTSSLDQQVSRNGQGSSPWGVRSWVLGGQQSEREPQSTRREMGPMGFWGRFF